MSNDLLWHLSTAFLVGIPGIIISSIVFIGGRFMVKQKKEHQDLHERVNDLSQVLDSIAGAVDRKLVRIDTQIEHHSITDSAIVRMLEEHEVLKTRLNRIEAQYEELLDKNRPVGYRDAAKKTPIVLARKRSWLKRVACWFSSLIHGSFVYVKIECVKCGYEHARCNNH